MPGDHVGIVKILHVVIGAVPEQFLERIIFRCLFRRKIAKARMDQQKFLLIDMHFFIDGKFTDVVDNFLLSGGAQFAELFDRRLRAVVRPDAKIFLDGRRVLGCDFAGLFVA